MSIAQLVFSLGTGCFVILAGNFRTACFLNGTNRCINGLLLPKKTDG